MSKFELTINGPDLSFHREIDEEGLGRVMAALLLKNEHTGFVTPGAAPPTEQVATRPKVSIGEFMRESGTRSNAERIAAIALYLRDFVGQETFRREDLAPWFKKAGFPVPKNVWRDVTKAVKQRMIAEDHSDKGAFYLTQTGEEHLDQE